MVEPQLDQVGGIFDEDPLVEDEQGILVPSSSLHLVTHDQVRSRSAPWGARNAIEQRPPHWWLHRVYFYSEPIPHQDEEIDGAMQRAAICHKTALPMWCVLLRWCIRTHVDYRVRTHAFRTFVDKWFKTLGEIPQFNMVMYADETANSKAVVIFTFGAKYNWASQLDLCQLDTCNLPKNHAGECAEFIDAQIKVYQDFPPMEL